MSEAITPTESATGETPFCNAHAVFPAINDGSDTLHPSGTHLNISDARTLERQRDRAVEALKEAERVLGYFKDCADSGLARDVDHALARIRDLGTKGEE